MRRFGLPLLLAALASMTGCGGTAPAPPKVLGASARGARCPATPLVDRSTASGETLVAGEPATVVICRCIPVTNGRVLRDGLTLPGPPEPHWPDEGLL